MAKDDGESGVRVERVEGALVPSSRGRLPLAPRASERAAAPLPNGAPFEVPDLELAPPSRRREPAPHESMGIRAAPSLFEADESAEEGLELSLDLPRGEALHRRPSAPQLLAVRPAAGEGQYSSAGPGPRSTSSLPAAAPRSSSSLPAAAPRGSPVPHAAGPRSAPTMLVAPDSGRPRSSSPPESRRVLPQSLESWRSVANRVTPDPDATFLQRLRPGLLLIGGAIGVTILDQAYSASSGQVLSVGPVRTSVLAALLMAVGVAVSVYRVRSH